MFDSYKGHVLRNMNAIATPNCGILHIKWTDKPTLALCSDTGGSVWSINFTRRLGIRGFDARCIFSGARGEVCCFEPLFFNGEYHPLRNYTIAAFVTLSKVFVVMIKPKLRVIKFHPLTGPPDCLPLLSWHLVLIQLADSTKTVDPVLATAKGSIIIFFQLTFNGGKVSLIFLRQVNLSCNLLSLHWISNKSIIYLDASETLHLLDVKSCKEIDVLDVSEIGLAYESALYKGLATGGNVSKAFSLIGSHACYNSIVLFGSQLYMLSSQNVHVINARAWSERLAHLTQSQRWEEAFEIAVDGYRNACTKNRRQQAAREKVLWLIDEYMKATNRTPELCLEHVVSCLVEINETKILWGELWERQHSTFSFLDAITKLIIDEKLNYISTDVAQALCEYLFQKDNYVLEEIILKLDWKCLDLHQVLTFAKKAKLFRAQLYLNAQALGDYTVSLIELIPCISEEPNIGNHLLVYISFCLAGRGYPIGEIPKENVQNIKNEILRCLTAFHSPNGEKEELPFPYLRTLINYNIRETLNVIALAFQEKEFNGDLGLSHKFRIINILMEILAPENSTHSQRACLMNFIATHIAANTLPHQDIILSKVFNYISMESNSDESPREHWEREQAWLELLRANCFANISEIEMIELAQRAQCNRVTEYLLIQRKQYDQVIKTYISDPRREMELTHYLFRFANDPERKIYVQVRENLKKLIKINAAAIAKLVIENYIQELDDLIDQLPSSFELYSFLECLVRENIPLAVAHNEIFIEMMCQFDPNGVLNFLKSNSSYNLKRVLDICRNNDNNDIKKALVYLYEKNNDFASALEIELTLFGLASENSFEDYITEITALCTRCTGKYEDKEILWFRWLDVLFSRHSLISFSKSVLHTASSFVDLGNLVQFVLNYSAKDENFCHIRDVLMLLSNSKCEYILFENSNHVLCKDLQNKIIMTRRAAVRGTFIKSIKCVLCRFRLDQFRNTVVILPCGHALHKRCHDIQVNLFGRMQCPRCWKCCIQPVRKLCSTFTTYSNSNFITNQ